MSTQTTVATSNPTAPAKLTLKQHLEGPSFIDALKKALPKHMKPDRFIRVALTTMTKTPKLAQCDQASFFAALLTLSQLGIEPDGRRAHLIPFENRKRGVVECQLIIDWKGLAELVMRSGLVSTLHADVVRTGDLFKYSAGELQDHEPHFLRVDSAKPAKAGDIYAVYCVAKMKDGARKVDVMSLDEVEAIRRRSRSGNSGPWVTDWNEMAKKTVFRRLSKWLPLSPEFRDAIEADDELPANIKDVTPAPDFSGGLAAMIEAGSQGADVPADSHADLEAAPANTEAAQ